MGLNKKMLDKEFELQMDEMAQKLQYELYLEDQFEIYINEILDEAARWGMRQEVYESAQQNIQNDPSIDVITAYNMAFSEWIK